jgi:glycine/D-amino acid oxidase-like deaminating enzyme
VEKDKVGSGASGRNGSMRNQGITINPAEARKRYGQPRARELYDAFRAAGHERDAAVALHRARRGFLVETLHGAIRAKQVMAATDAYSDKAMPWFRKRLINVGSFVIVTEPLGEERARQVGFSWGLRPAHGSG